VASTNQNEAGRAVFTGWLVAATENWVSLQFTTAHSVQMKWGQVRWDERSLGNLEAGIAAKLRADDAAVARITLRVKEHHVTTVFVLGTWLQHLVKLKTLTAAKFTACSSSLTPSDTPQKSGGMKPTVSASFGGKMSSPPSVSLSAYLLVRWRKQLRTDFHKISGVDK